MPNDNPQNNAAVSDPSLLEAAQAAIRILQSSPDCASYFASVIDWLRDRHTTWSRRSWRVGLIGITSSGKSSLVNALLNERLLPVAVRPSSNSLVVCRRGPEARALVHYTDGGAEEVRGAALRTHLKALTDEETNPGNSLGVKEIELETPGFQLGERIALIDTPGLDAYGFEKHEQLTIELLLPTVDVAVFLTTAKANADRQISNHLATIEGLSKPIVLVQNMIDSVEPKLGMDGRVLKTRAQVAHDHHQRLRRLLRQAIPTSEGRTPIVQISAKAALENRAQESGLPLFVEAIEGHLATLAPRLGRARRVQLREFLARCVAQESGQSELENRTVLDGLEASLRQLERDLGDFRGSLYESFRMLRSDGVRAAAAFKEQAGRIGVQDNDSAKQVLNNVTSWRNHFAGEAIKVLTTHRELLRQHAAVLSLRFEDFSVQPPVVRKFQRSAVPQQTQSRTVRVKKPGLWSGFKRLFDVESGWDHRTETWEEVDVAEFRASVSRQLEESLEWCDKARDGIISQLNEHQLQLQQEVNRQLTGVKDRLATTVAREARLQAVARLKPIIEMLKAEETRITAEEARETPDQPATSFERPHPIKVIPAVVPTLVLAQHASRQRFLKLRRLCLSRAEQREPGASRRTLLWAWDRDALESFIHRFWFDEPQARPPEKPGLSVVAGTMLALGGEYGGELAADAAQRAVDALARPATVFLLVDLEQPGSTQSHLARSPLQGSLVARKGLVLVVQSVGGLRATAHLVEALGELKKTAAEFRLDPAAVIANNSSVGLSLLVNELWYSGEQLKTLDDEQHWIGKFGRLGIRSPAVDVPGIVRSWRELLASDAQGRRS